MNISQKREDKECCPRFHPEKWEEKMFNWNKKKFITTSVPTLFHIPFRKTLGKKITKMMKQAEKTGNLTEDKEDVLLLFTDPHPFRSDMYLSVIDEVPGEKNTTISGTFLTKVFDGDYKELPKFIKKMDTYLSDQNKKAKNYYVHYAYCPKCSEESGHNYQVLFTELV